MKNRHVLFVGAGQVLLTHAFLGCSAVLLMLAAPACCYGQVALPDFSLIGTGFSAQSNLWIVPHPSVYPKQITIDYTSRGTVYGLVCKYGIGTNTLAQLRSAVQEKLNSSPRLENTNLFVWRLEERKLTVMLTRDEDRDLVDLIVTSIDRRIRNED